MGYPLTRDLLYGLKRRVSLSFRKQFEKVVSFHHPRWDGRWETLPDIEELLTQITTNEDLLPLLLRPHDRFGPRQLGDVKNNLLLEIARWFHDIHENKSSPQKAIMEQLVDRIGKSENPIVISFNWDYELDRGIFGEHVDRGNIAKIGYGLGTGEITSPAILKPHGSLNWYLESLGQHFKADRARVIWKPSAARRTKEFESVFCFLRWREPTTKHDRNYVPWIVPPTHVKSFSHPMLRSVWKRCADVLGRANKVFFLGYSLPAADWHSRYILRCGFYGRSRDLHQKGSADVSGHRPPEVTIVNPDNSAFRRIEATVGERCRWVPKTIAQWLEMRGRYPLIRP
jgi:hypothetical protein